MIKNLDDTIKLLQGLPFPLREAIFSPELAEFNWQLKEKYYLEERQMTKMAGEIGLVLAGEKPLKQLEENLTKEAGIAAGVAVNLGQEIRERVFKPLAKYFPESL